MPNDKTIFIEVEIFQREFYPKLILGLELALRGHKVILGESSSIFSLLNLHQNCIFIGKNIFNFHSAVQTSSKVKRLHARGHRIIYSHEEGLVFPGNFEQQREVFQSLYPPNFLNDDDYILYWGGYSKDLETRMVRGRPVIAGNPRFSFYKYLDWKIEPNNRGIILLNGKWTSVLNRYGLNNQNIYEVTHQNLGRELAIDFVAKELRSVALTLEIIPKLCKIAETYKLDVVYRPHPSEEDSFFIRNIFSSIPNFRVECEVPLYRHLQQAVVVVSEGCTTAIDAYCAGRPFVEYPNEKQNVDPIQSKFSYRPADLPSLFRVVDYFCREKSGAYEDLYSVMRPSEKRELVYYLADVDVDSIAAICNIVNTINFHKTKNASLKATWAGFCGQQHKTLKRKFAKALVKLLPEHKREKIYWSEQFFPDTAIKTLTSFVSSLKKLEYSQLDIKKPTRWTFEIAANKRLRL